MKYWELVADKLSKAGWSLGWVSAVDARGRTMWIVEAHRGDGQRFVVHADEKLTAFLELESAIRAIERRLFSSKAGSRNGWKELPSTEVARQNWKRRGQ